MDVTGTPWVTESTLQNKSDWEDFYRQWNMTSKSSKLLEFIISLVGLSGNTVVIWLLAFRMQRNAFSVYILNLAGADFIFLSNHMVFSIMKLVGHIRLDSMDMFRVYIMTLVFPYVVGLSLLTAISMERCLCVLKPIWYRCHRPKHMSSVVCALLWTLPLLLTILRVESEGIFFGFYLLWIIDIIIATWLIFSFVLLSGSSLVLLTRLLCGSRKMKLTGLYVTIGLTVLVFLLCGLPWGIYHFLLYWMSTALFMHCFKLTLVTEVLSCVNSCANPIIYFFVGSYREQQRQKRRSLKLILQTAWQDVPEEDGSQSNPPQETLEMSGNTHLS
ncbi:mas-related G-protein coupled receptor member X1-like [Sorex fumeus]|uniref:mas-related G-protein coupled receptor member X1-like n=1 Tax=Sorex fumeus TaxID=62283 RepID=UPI0024AD8F68|nr:mas-related G-protein coupled receptor member X1-like [Sorex fumeus]